MYQVQYYILFTLQVCNMSIYAVNGKNPIAAWIPSRDTLRSGTTTLTDLVGNNNGTLTNMDPATDWVVSDEKYALDFDGVNDRVVFSNINLLSAFSISFWVYLRVLTTNAGMIYADGPNFSGIRYNAGLNYYSNNLTVFRLNPFSANQWIHVVVTRNASGSCPGYLDGVLRATGSGGGMSGINAFGYNKSNPYMNGMLDDIRFFDVALDAADVTYLYNNGVRGVISGPPLVITSRRRRSSRGGFGL